MTTQKTSQSPLEPYRADITALYGQPGSTLQGIADAIKARYGIKTTRDSIRRAVRRWDLKRPEFEEPGVHIKDNEAEVVSHPIPQGTVLTPEEILQERGLDPSEWEIYDLVIKGWDGMTSDKAFGDNRLAYIRQIVVRCRKIVPVNLVFPARTPGDYRRPPKLVVQHAEKPVRRVVFVGDQQAPYHNTKLHELFLEWLQHNRPDEGVLMGDTVDLPDQSRHSENPEWHVEAQECIDSGYLILRDYVQANEDVQWTKLIGNHDERIRTRLINYNTKQYGLRRALVPGQDPEIPSHHIAHLLRLDELGIEWVDPGGNYDHGQHKLSKHLAARHGWIARKGSGASALATLEHLGFSVVVGHTHRQSLVYKTTHDIDGNASTLAAAETGCMCRIEGGLGYTPSPDWQNGFATATIWPDGTFRLEHATFVNDRLYYRDQCFS